MIYVLLLVGFVLLIKGADFFVDGASAIARLLRVPSVIVGLTVVAMGTSAPEAAVSITAGLAGNNAIAISNVVGSNIFNLLVVTGVCAMIKPFVIEKGLLKRDFPINILITIVVLICVATGGQLSRTNGFILLAIMLAYLILTIISALKNRVKIEDGSEAGSKLYQILENKIAKRESGQGILKALLSIAFCAVGLIAIIYGGDMVVNNASAIAKTFGLSDTFIGLTIVAVGTSLPELVTSIVASKKGQSGMAIGNVVGSNIFNLALILGLSSTIHPITTSLATVMDMGILLVTTCIMFAFCITGKQKMHRWEGIVSVSIYAAYMVYIVMR